MTIYSYVICGDVAIMSKTFPSFKEAIDHQEQFIPILSIGKGRFVVIHSTTPIHSDSLIAIQYDLCRSMH